MEMMEVVLLIAGGIIFILSFFIPDGKKDSGSAESAKALTEGELQGLISREMNSIRTHVDDVVEEAVTYAMEKTERSLERLSNEKIMAVNEYSDTVLAEIHKNHEEAMFLYDMLNNKHANLKNTVSEVNRTIKEAETTVMSFQKLAPETLSISEESTEVLGMGAPGWSQPEDSGWESLVADRMGLDDFGSRNEQMEMLGLRASEPGKPGVQNPEAAQARISDPTAVKGGTNAGNGNKSGTNDSAIQNIRLEKDIMQQAVTDRPGLEGARQEGAGSETAGSDRADSVRNPEGQRNNNNDRILELYQQGKSIVDIARQLDLGVGEVKLVIDLFKNQ